MIKQSLHKQVMVIVRILLLVSAPLHSQVNSSNFDHFTVREGLPSEQLYNCCQDREGFLWVATDAGVSRFDGKSFRNFNINDGLGDNEIHEIYQDRRDRIWFIPFSGKLSFYYKGKIFTQNIDALAEEPLRGITNHVSMAEDSVGDVYICKSASTRIVKLEGPEARTVVYDLARHIGSDEGFGTFHGAAQNQMICITTRQRLLLLDKTGVRDVTPPHFLEEEQPCRFYINHKAYKGYSFLSGEKGIYKLTGSSAKLIIPNEALPVPGVNNFIQVKYDNFNNVWLNHLYGNTVFYKATENGYCAPMSVMGNLFSLVAFDNENNIWFSTNNGLYKTTYAKLQDKLTFDINHNLVAQKVISCAMDKDSGLWLGYSNGYVSRFKGQSVKHYNLKIERKTNNRIIQVKPDPAGNLLIGTDETVLMIRRKKRDVYETPVIFRQADGNYLRCSAKSIFFNRQGEAFLSEPFTQYLLQLDQASGYVKKKIRIFNITNARRFCSFYDSKDRLYTSTIDGFNVLENEHFTDLARQDERFNVRIQDYAEAPDGTIFLAAYNNGIIAMKDKHFVSSISRFNTQTAICRRIYLKNDTLYVATNCGIGILVFREGKFKLVKLVSVSDGLISSDVNDLAFLGNKLFAATSHGVSSFETVMRPAVHATAPTLVLQSIEADDSLCSVNSQLNLSYKTKAIRINFIAPVLDRPELTLYRYRFNAADSWQVTSANYIEFSKLVPGRYHIEIQAKRNNSDWSAPGKINFSISPPFYNTIWFIGSAVLLAVFCTFLVVRSVMHKRFREQLYALQQKEAIEKERNRIAADIHDDIGAELTNITILSQILKYTAGHDKDESLKVVNKIESSSNQIITKMNEVIWTLNAKNHTLKNLVSHIRNYITTLGETSQADIKANISESTQINYPLTAEYTRDIFLVVKELLQNAVKHSRATSVEISISLSELYTLHIDYSDNGVGFDTSLERSGNGLGNIRQRVRANKGKIITRSGINQGCEVHIHFPLAVLQS